METLQTAEHVSEGNKSSSLLYKQIQSLLFRQRELQLFHSSETTWALKLPLTTAAVCGGGEGSYFLLLSAKSLQLP